MQEAWAGAWTVPERHWEIYQDATGYRTDYYYDARGNRIGQDSYNKIESGTRIEYGLHDGLTVGAAWQIAAVLGTETFSLPAIGFIPAISVDVRWWNYGIADPKFYARQRLWQDATSVLSAQGTLKLPSLFRYLNLPRSGSDDFSYEARILGGHNFELADSNHFANLEVAYEWRPHNSGNLVHIDGTLGFNITDNVMLLPQIFSTWASSDGDGRFTQTGNDAYDLVKPQLSAVYKFNDALSLQAGAFHHAYARNTGGGGGILLGLWIKQ